jgi:hypothetical protein
MGGMSDLSHAAFGLCEEVRAGAWSDALKRVPNGQPAACFEVIEALRLRCPGHATADYQAAIARGMFETR